MERFDAKQYRRSLLLRWLLMLVVFFGALGCVIWNLVLLFTVEEPRYALVGIIGYMLLSIMQSSVIFLPRGVSVIKCLKDDVLLRRAWNEEHDERRMLICAKAGVPLIPVVAMILYAVGLVLLIPEHMAARGIGVGILFAGGVFMAVSNTQYTRWNRRLSEEEAKDEA